MRPVSYAPALSTLALPQDKFRLIDVLKIGAVQLIVLHHLAWYGPMSDQVALIAPSLIEWLAVYGRIAVQVFLVCGGFLAARSLHGNTARTPWRPIGRRYLKLVPPFMIALLLTSAASALASHWMQHPSISPAPTVWQFLAHALLLHGVLKIPALSAGVWYVAIDFQLYAVLAILVWLARRRGAEFFRRSQQRAGAVSMTAATLIAFGCALSLLFINRLPAWDDWAPYFFGSYGMGALAWWVGRHDSPPRAGASLWSVMMVVVLVALALDFRSRIAVAAVVANLLILGFGARASLATWSPSVALWIDRASAASYAVFLIHFPVCLLINALFTRFVAPEPALQAVGMLLAWCASLLAGVLFHRTVEQPCARWLQLRHTPPAMALQRGLRT
ncbi:MAG: acyltransferase [Pseudomonadota bacterium]|nr:acyltransferase [Pseudomonadota bacterium]